MYVKKKKMLCWVTLYLRTWKNLSWDHGYFGVSSLGFREDCWQNVCELFNYKHFHVNKNLILNSLNFESYYIEEILDMISRVMLIIFVEKTENQELTVIRQSLITYQRSDKFYSISFYLPTPASIIFVVFFTHSVFII